MNIYLFELKRIRKSTILWTVVLSALCALFMFIFPVYVDNTQQVKAMLNGFPPEMLSALGINIDTLFSLLGFYSFIFIYITFCGAVQAANLGIGIISRENRAKTSDFLLTKPIDRKKIFTAKLLASFTSLVFTNIVYLIVSTCICLGITDIKFDMKALLLISFTLFFIQLVFASIGVLYAVLFDKIKSVVTISLCISFAFFVISMLDSFIKKDLLKYITPYKYFDKMFIIKNLSYEPASLITVFVICTFCIFTSYVLYIKKDVNSV